MELYLLFESAAGYALLHVKEWEQVGQSSPEVQAALRELPSYSQAVKLKAFHAFRHAEEALDNMNAIAAGEVTDTLKTFLEANLPPLAKKKGKFALGVCEPNLGKALGDAGFPATMDKNVAELARATRLHWTHLTKGLQEIDLERARVGLGHSYSRSKLQFDPNRQDKPIIQSIALIDNLDKNVNLFAMRVREWYSWHFPELAKIVTDNIKFAEVAKVIQVKETFIERDDCVEQLTAVLNGDEDMANEILSAAKISMGQEITQVDMENILKFCDQVIKLAHQRKTLVDYLASKLEVVAPNLRSLIGDTVAARLISHAGSLVNLAKYPASTVQILGAEKALFRALKTRGNTPKYGLLFQSTFIGRAAQKNKGRISRYLANKCSLAARIDNFGEVSSSVFGNKMREQVEERLTYLSDRNIQTKKNIQAMKEALTEHSEELARAAEAEGKKKKKKKTKKKAAEEEEAVPMDQEEEAPEAPVAADEGTKKKQKKKRQREGEKEEAAAAAAAEADVDMAAAAAEEEPQGELS